MGCDLVFVIVLMLVNSPPFIMIWWVIYILLFFAIYPIHVFVWTKYFFKHHFFLFVWNVYIRGLNMWAWKEISDSFDNWKEAFVFM